MRALILCGGLGTRLKPLTNKIPKPMIKVGGKPALEHIINHILSFGIDEIILDTHYKADVIIDYFGDSVLYNYQKELKSEDETLESLMPWLQFEDTLVVNGDTLTNLDIKAMHFMAHGNNIMYMDTKDKKIFAGYKIITPTWWVGNKHFIPFYSSSFWIDFGSFNGLRKAREKYGY